MTPDFDDAGFGTSELNLGTADLKAPDTLGASTMNRAAKHTVGILLMLLSIQLFLVAEKGGGPQSASPASTAQQSYKAQPTPGTERIRRTVRFRTSATVSPTDCAWSDCRSCSQYRRLCGQEEYAVFENVPADPMSSVTADLKHSLHDTSQQVSLKALESESKSVSLQAVSRFELKTPGSPADVWAHGNYAYLASFDAPSCSSEFTGVSVIDISDPSSPLQVAFLPEKQGTRPNDLKVGHIETRSFSGDLLVLSSEPCNARYDHRSDSTGTSVSPGERGLAIWDVTDPSNPSVLAKDFVAFSVRSSFVWQKRDEAYMMLVNGDNGQDIHILDITDPGRPTEVAVTGRSQWPRLGSSEVDPASVYANSAWVQRNDTFVTAYLAYWDAGLVLLDVTDAADPVYLGASLYPTPDVSGETPGSSCDIAIPSRDGRIAVLGDREDTLMRVMDVSDPSRIVQLGHYMPDDVPENGPPPSDGIGSSGFVRAALGYWSWTGEGIRVVDFSSCIPGGGFDSCLPSEIAHFTDGGGEVEGRSRDSQPWSVYVHDHPNGDPYILGSDRRSGLWILSHP